MQPEDLKNQDQFRRIAVLKHEKILPFLQEHLWSKNKVMNFYFAFNILLALSLIGIAIIDLVNGNINGWNLLLWLSYGAAISFTILIVIHELIHGITYKILGAPNVSYGADLKNFIFYATADKFVVNRSKFIKIALGPFIIVTSVCLLSLIFTNVASKWLFLGVLLIHSSMCAGDFGLLSYFENHKDKDIYTYDDVKNKVSYFYEKLK